MILPDDVKRSHIIELMRDVNHVAQKNEFAIDLLEAGE